ncbi:MAG: bifunctional phosphopantothenoylcysteine decarboxylase/phosphopantothenate--cysteine ligase CoaBC [Bacillota bacterium]
MNNIVLGVTGGIAAYKVVQVASNLTQIDYNIDVVMTESAKEFVTPLTFRTITRNPVESDLFSPPQNFEVKHISLAKKADLFLIAPATANFISKIASGIADDLLSTLILATRAPVLIAPAMNVNMYNNSIIQDNINYLKEKGFKFIIPESGYLACGDTGKGRLPDPPLLTEAVISELTPNILEGKKVLVTAGPTREPLDPVRYISNYSSGKMGYALAKAAFNAGGEVTLVSGPVSINSPFGVKTQKVETAREMAKKINDISSNYDIIIMAAAVADFRPHTKNKRKIKKEKFEKSLNLTSNPDILKKLGKNKNNDQILIGFAAETSNLIQNAEKKLKEKNLDMIIANDISKSEIGFGSESNEVTIIDKYQKEKIRKMDKQKLAELIIKKIYDNLLKEEK